LFWNYIFEIISHFSRILLANLKEKLYELGVIWYFFSLENGLKDFDEKDRI